MHPRTPMVEFLPDSCKKKQCWSFDIYTILLSKLAIMARQTTPMRCPMQYEERSTHALTRRGRRHTNISHIDYRSTRHATRLNKKEHGGGKNDRRHDSCVSNPSRDVNRTTYSPFWGTHGHADLKPLDSTCQQLAEPNAAAVT